MDEIFFKHSTLKYQHNRDIFSQLKQGHFLGFKKACEEVQRCQIAETERSEKQGGWKVLC